jgi:hypothetical protein
VLRRSMIAAFGAALSLFAGTALAAQVDGAEVDSVTIFAPADVRLTLAVGGQVSRDHVVTSAPVGMHCGGDAFQYDTDDNHQCWLWVRRNQPVILTAQGSGVYGRDWTVVWSGCEPVAGGPACTLTPKQEAVVAAVFSRPTP